MNKVYLESPEDLLKTGQSGEKVFIEYKNCEEEIEYADRFGSYDWEFTLDVYSRLFPNNYIKFFKKI